LVPPGWCLCNSKEFFTPTKFRTVLVAAVVFKNLVARRDPIVRRASAFLNRRQ